MFYIVQSTFHIYEDDFNEGEIRYANFFEQSVEVSALNKINAIAEAMRKMHYGFDHNFLDTDDGECRYSILVDEDNFEASDQEIENWKIGKQTLYSANIEFKVYRMEEE